MAERPEDLNLPNAVIARIIKEALPDGVNVSKDARQAISKAASVFVLYATSCANNIAMEKKRKTLAAQDVLDAMKEMEFDKFIEPLKTSLENYKRDQQGRKDAAAENRKKSKEATVAEEQQEEADDGEEDVHEVNDATDDGDESQTDDVIMQD